jgi:hypothetical protein
MRKHSGNFNSTETQARSFELRDCRTALAGTACAIRERDASQLHFDGRGNLLENEEIVSPWRHGAASRTVLTPGGRCQERLATTCGEVFESQKQASSADRTWIYSWILPKGQSHLHSTIG